MRLAGGRDMHAEPSDWPSFKIEDRRMANVLMSALNITGYRFMRESILVDQGSELPST